MAVAAPIPVRTVASDAPLRWLARGWLDLRYMPLISLLHGALVAIGGWIVVLVSLRYWWLAPGAFSAFVLVGPILVTGLYELSCARQQGLRPGGTSIWKAWRRARAPLLQLGMLLAALGIAWVAISSLLFALFVPTPIRGPSEFLRYAVVEQGDLLFVLWLVLGGLVAATVFAVTVVSPPLLLCRCVDLRTAILTSVRAVGQNPVPMALWAFIIMLAITLSLATFLLGFLLTVPVLGHATWYAYQDLVDAEGIAQRCE